MKRIAALFLLIALLAPIAVWAESIDHHEWRVVVGWSGRDLIVQDLWTKAIYLRINSIDLSNMDRADLERLAVLTNLIQGLYGNIPDHVMRKWIKELVYDSRVKYKTE